MGTSCYSDEFKRDAAHQIKSEPLQLIEQMSAAYQKQGPVELQINETARNGIPLCFHPES